MATLGDMLRKYCTPICGSSLPYFDAYTNAQVVQAWDELDDGAWMFTFMRQLPQLDTQKIVDAARACAVWGMNAANPPAHDDDRLVGLQRGIDRIDAITGTPTAKDVRQAIAVASGAAKPAPITSPNPPSIDSAVLSGYAVQVRTVVSGADIDAQLEDDGTGTLKPKGL